MCWASSFPECTGWLLISKYTNRLCRRFIVRNNSQRSSHIWVCIQHRRFLQNQAVLLAPSEMESRQNAIKKLPDDVISQIAAGEVVTSPTIVIKEAIENSLDAGASSIKVFLKKDFSIIDIIDDGTGIHEDDLPNVCERHFTSKFTGSLYDLDTFGFRGEALASISQVSRVTIETRSKDSEHGYRAEFENYKMISSCPVSLNFGTRLVIRDLFCNNYLRREHFSCKKEEILIILQVITAFSIFNYTKHFSLVVDKHTKFIHTPHDLPYSLSNIHQDYSNAVMAKKHLINTYFKTQDHLITDHRDGIFIIMSRIGYTSRKYDFIIFINKRLVTHNILRDKILKIYKQIIPKHTYPFFYIEIEIASSCVDVNIHPAKKEVIFEGEAETINSIVEKVQALLESQGKFETKNTQNKKQGVSEHGNTSHNIYTDPKISSIIDFVGDTQRSQKPHITKIYKYKSLERIRDEIVRIDTDFCTNLVYVGETDNKLFVQSAAQLFICDFMSFKKIFFHDYLVMNFGNVPSNKCRPKSILLTDPRKSKILNSFFGFQIAESMVNQVPSICGVTLTDTLEFFIEDFEAFSIQNEEETFRFIFSTLSDYLSKDSYSGPSLFNSIKRNVISTRKILDTFSLVTSLTELYKLFERC